MNDNFDIGIIGMGVAGAFACTKLLELNNSIKIIGFDLGRGFQKRRRQLDGWLGCLPNSDGKLYLNDIKEVTNKCGVRRTKAAHKFFNKILHNSCFPSLVTDKLPNASVEKLIKKNGYSLLLNDYYQIIPRDVHVLSKYMSSLIDKHENVTMSFDNEIFDISKKDGMFIIYSEDGEYKCKQLIFCVGRSGWRFANQIYSSLGIISNNDVAKIGIRVEMNSEILKDFNKSSCTLIKENELEIGPFNWNGTVIPEDHVETVISAFRSNENRWTTEKVSFPVIGLRKYPNQGFEQIDRLSKLTFILSNDRVIKEKVSYILSGKSKISILSEYDWLKEVLINLSEFIPDILTKAYFHVPTIVPMASKINVGSNMSTEIEGLYVAGESANLRGILSAACTGVICAETIIKG